MAESELQKLRREYHVGLAATILGERSDGKGITLADSANSVSRDIARLLVERMDVKMAPNPDTGQTAGSVFAELTREFLQKAFDLLAPLRPGRFRFTTSQAKDGIGRYEQYSHLLVLAEFLKEHPQLEASLGAGYLITPDILVVRGGFADDELNRERLVVAGDGSEARKTPVRSLNRPPGHEILHASISCKWTIRSDRAQNTRTEALNLVRNRKGHLPHVVAVTAEPLPSRLMSLALGTGDIDCTYHMALPELIDAVGEHGREDIVESIATMVQGHRLRDISDLAVDLIV